MTSVFAGVAAIVSVEGSDQPGTAETKEIKRGRETDVEL